MRGLATRVNRHREGWLSGGGDPVEMPRPFQEAFCKRRLKCSYLHGSGCAGPFEGPYDGPPDGPLPQPAKGLLGGGSFERRKVLVCAGGLVWSPGGLWDVVSWRGQACSTSLRDFKLLPAASCITQWGGCFGHRKAGVRPWPKILDMAHGSKGSQGLTKIRFTPESWQTNVKCIRTALARR